MFNIAQRGNTTVDNLVSGNCLVDASLISVGQVLYVPSPIQPPENDDRDEYQHPDSQQDFLEYWLISEVDSPIDGIQVGCESYIVPVATEKIATGNTIEDLTTALNDLLAPNQQYLDGVTNYILEDQNLFVDSVTLDNDHATVQIGGQLYGLGTCADPIFEGQIVQTIFQFEEIQSVTVMNGGMNLREFVDMSDRPSIPDHIYTR